MRTVPACEFEFDIIDQVLVRQPSDHKGSEDWLGGTVEELLVIFRGGLPAPYYRVRIMSHSSFGGKSESVLDYPAGEVKGRPTAPMIAAKA